MKGWRSNTPTTVGAGRVPVSASPASMLSKLSLTHSLVVVPAATYGLPTAPDELEGAADSERNRETERRETDRDGTIQYNTLQYSTVQYNILQYNTVRYNTVPHISAHSQCQWFTAVAQSCAELWSAL